jgi:Zn-dependent metalloprotease
VIVQFEQQNGKVITIGADYDAIRDPRLNAGEHQAVENAVRALRYLHERFGYAGYDDAGSAVHLLLGYTDADTRGPYATEGQITAGSRNPVASPGDTSAVARVVLPYDVVLHELTHVVQFAGLGTSWQQLNSQLTEGMADAMSMIATHDWSIGEDYFHRGVGGRLRETIRDIDPRAHVQGEPLVVDWRKVRDGNVEDHAAGAVVSRTFYEIVQRLGWTRAQDLLWAVLRDQQTWTNGGTWPQFASGLVRAADTMWPQDAAAQTAVLAAMQVTHLDAALAPQTQTPAPSQPLAREHAAAGARTLVTV